MAGKSIFSILADLVSLRNIELITNAQRQAAIEQTVVGAPVDVISSVIDRIAYDPNTRVLFVWFRSGSEYRYSNVSPLKYQQFLDAPSKGTFLNNIIKPSRYPYDRIAG